MAAQGQRGTVSALAVGIDRIHGTGQELIAVGTFSGNVAVYMLNDSITSSEQACIAGWKEDKSQGITQVCKDKPVLYPCC
jgi:hypothetical protein